MCVVALQILAVLLPRYATGAAPSEAQITQVVNDVRVLGTNVAPHPAAVNDKVGAGTTCQTGGASCAELIFADQTLTQLAPNTAFSFKDGTRNLNLADGAVLVQTPKKARGAKICAGAVVAAVTGTTAMFEYHPGVYKFLVLEGNGRLYRPGHWGDSILVHAGQMVIGNPNTAVNDPVDFDIDRFLKTSHFIIDFPPLRSERLMASESQKQRRAKSKKVLIDTNLVIFGGGTRVSLIDPTQVGAGSPSPAASPAPLSSPVPTSETLVPAPNARPVPNQMPLPDASPSGQ
jgi:quercetin dioxygenase-like cupin family protein